jgi:carbon-monoxide dehydrogenase large subunit
MSGGGVVNIEETERVSGRTRFSADVEHVDALEVAFVYSTEPHALIRGIDTSAATAAPGVISVLIGRDIGPILTGRAILDYPVLAVDRVAFIGQRVAAIAAVDRASAEAAASLVAVDYESLDPIFDIDEAYSAPTAAIHPDYASYVGAVLESPVPNAQGAVMIVDGDAAGALAGSDAVYEHVFTTPRSHSAPMEPHATLLVADDNEVQVHSTNKSPYFLRKYLAQVSGRPEEDITVHPVNIGGDFGSKGYPMVEGALYFLAMATGRPVRSVMSYYEELTTTAARHPARFRLRSGVLDGKLHGHESDTLLDGGAFVGPKAVPGGVVPTWHVSTGPYDVSDVSESVIAVYTNALPGGHVRSPGEFQMSFAGESHIDMIARARGENPISFRLRSAADEHVVGVLEMLATIDADWRPSLGAESGIGVSLFHRDAGPGSTTVGCRASIGGGIEISVGVPDQGAGSYTVFRRLVARVLDVSEDVISIRNTGTAPDLVDSGAGASRVTTVAGRACVEAARTLLAEVGEPDRTGDDGWIDRRLAELGRTEIETVGSWSAAWPPPPEERLRSYGGLIVEVSVDRQTGVVNVDRAHIVIDGGSVVNPVGHRGQIEGGFVYGLSQSLLEDLTVEDGQVMTVSLGDYKLASVADVPPLEITLIEPEELDGDFFGIKAIGELGNLGVAPAIANAIDDAIGVRIQTLPITAERVWRALRNPA